MNVFDFDNTIYDGESFIDFFFCYMKTEPSLIKYIPAIGVALLKYKRGKINIDDMLGKYGGKVTEYYLKMAGNGGTLSVFKFWDTHMKKIRPFYEDVRSDGDVIISCSPELSIKEVCRRMGIKHYICSTIDEKSGAITRLCFRENKVKAFFDEYPDGKIDSLYTDSMNDKPLMDISKNVYLVKGKKITKIK